MDNNPPPGLGPARRGAGPAGTGASFAGREEATAVLGAAFDDAAAGRPRIVVVEGPAGVGKTALIEHFAAGHRRERTVMVSSLESEARVPFGVAAQLLRDLAGGGAPDLDGADEVTDVGARLLAALSAEPVTIVAIDDAQWADLPSLEALAFAFRRLDADRAITVIGMRPAPAAAAGELLGRLVQGGRGSHIELRALSAAEVARLAASAGQHLPPAAARRLQEHTGGLPLHVIALLRELDPASLRRASGPLPAPRSFSTLVLGRVAAAGVQVESLLAAAAVLGEGCAVATAAAVAGLRDPLEAVNGAAVAGLAWHRRGPAGDELWFSHALVRAAVLSALAPARLASLHRRAAARVGGVAVIEHLAAAAILPDDALAGRLADAARQEASRGAADQAAHYFLEAARLSPDPRAGRARRLDALEAMVLAGAVAAARGLADDLRADLEAGQPRAAYLRGHLALLDGRPPGAERLLETAWRGAEAAGDGRVAALAAAQLAQLCLVHARNPEAVTWSARAAEAAAGGDRALARAGHGIRLVALTFSGHPAQALAEAVPDERTADALQAGWFDDVAGRGLVRLWTDDLAGARRDLTAVSDPSLRHRPLRARLLALGYLAEADYRAGRWDDAVATGELAVSLASDAEHVWLLGLLHGIAALPLAGRGEWAAAASHIDLARRIGAELGDVMSLAYAGLAMIAVAAAKADMAGLLAVTDLFAAMDPAHGAMEPGVLTWCPARVEALAATGRHDEAAALAERAVDIAEARGRQSALAGALRARGILESARGHPDAAAAAFERAAACLPGGMTFESGLLGLAMGIHSRRSGHRRRAGEELRAALAAFDAVGARPYAERATAGLRGCGITPRKRGPAPPALTGREHAVAILVAEGLTNREIAGRLVLSTKTVEYHLANSFAKLGVRNRAQLAVRIGAPAAED